MKPAIKWSRTVRIWVLFFAVSGCSLFATRPVQEMSDTSAAIKAAREVQADVLAPELYRQANEWYLKAKNEYRLKNFREARGYANKSRAFAEEAEFLALRGGAQREDISVPEPVMPPKAKEEFQKPEGINQEDYENVMKEREQKEAAKKQALQQSDSNSNPTISPPSQTPVYPPPKKK